ncbi:MAG: quinol:electron acceptor oxidoreductase subunit ActD [Thermodesulfobacteriota bacterium]
MIIISSVAHDFLPHAWGAYGPMPNEAISEALSVKKSPVGWFTLAGGIIGFITGYLLASLTSMRWELIVSGKPVLAYIPSRAG